MKLIFVQDEYKSYDYIGEAETPALALVAFFLMDEVGTSNDTIWKKILLDSSRPVEEIQGNVLYLNKQYPRISIGWRLTFEDPYPDPNEVQTTCAELIAAIKTWVKLKQEGPAYIVLTYDNGQIKLEGSETLV